MKARTQVLVIAAALVSAGVLAFAAPAQERGNAANANAPFDRVIRDHSRDLMEEGRSTFRYDTFGDKAFWGDTLKLHRAIAGQALGGVGPGVSPRTALAVGLKVDADALPASLVAAIKGPTVLPPKFAGPSRSGRWSATWPLALRSAQAPRSRQ